MARQFPRKWTQMTFEKPSFQTRSKFDVICEQLAKNLGSFGGNIYCTDQQIYVHLYHGVIVGAVAGAIAAAIAPAGGDDNSLNLLPFGNNATSFTCILRCPSISRELVHVKELPEHNTSKYKEEFQQLEKLGKGGFGSVYKVKNKLDGQEYAVKKVHLSEKDHSNCFKVLREVKILALLRHPNVVGYQCSWVESVPNEKALSLKLPNQLVDLIDDQSPGFSNRLDSQENQYSDESHIVFQNSEASVGGDVSDELKEHKGPSLHSSVKLRGSLSPRHNLISMNSVGIHKSASDANLERFTSPKSYKNSHLHNHKPKNGHFVNEDDSSTTRDSVGSESPSSVLFIQMELCAIALKEWLSERNLEIYRNGGQVNSKYNTNIFKQIVNGMKYIHSEGLIHRDLKPSNIFLKRYDGSYEYQVKIGDFGLARTDLIRSDPPCRSHTSSELLEKTEGVGTETYAAPEQLHNRTYNSKVDIYSLAILLYEFYQPFNTEMEKQKSIQEIRKGIIPEDFKKLWPGQSALILRMMAKNPHDRPTAEDILSMSEKSKCHAELENKKNEFLRERIRELELELARKDETITQLQTEKARN